MYLIRLTNQIYGIQNQPVTQVGSTNYYTFRLLLKKKNVNLALISENR